MRYDYRFVSIISYRIYLISAVNDSFIKWLTINLLIHISVLIKYYIQFL